MNIIPTAYAHEQYVLTKDQLAQGFLDTHTNILEALRSPENIKISLLVGLGIIISLVIYFFFQYSKIGILLDKFLVKLDPLGHFLLRVAFAGSLIASAHFLSFMGPEISLASLAIPPFLYPAIISLMYLAGICLLVGFFTRFAAAVFLILLAAATKVYGQYIITYLNYYGEVIALIIFGTYFLSVDDKIFKTPKFVEKFKDWELLLIRVTYGISVLYPAITIKLVHPAVIVEIVNKYQINQINWLFPSDPLLISLGTGLAQILVGLMIIVGFETRFASIATFFLYLLSVLFFKEAVWPHYILLALALYLGINNGGKLSLDYWIGKKLKRT